MISFKKQQGNVEAVTQLLVKNLKVKVTGTTIKQCLTNHPDYPSLMAVDDCLTEWQVANAAYQTDYKNYDSKTMNYPFLAHIKTNGGNLILVYSIIGGEVLYGDEKNRKASMTEVDFLKKWSGTWLYADADEASGEANYKSSDLKEKLDNARTPLLILLAILAVLINVNYQTLAPSYALMLFFKLTGLSTGILLLIQSIDASNPLVQNLCGLNSKNNCNAILKSEAAKVTSWLTWSEVGFFYFAGSLLTLVINPNSLTVLAWINLFTLPYTVYSINYQYRQKNWCILCCTIQVLLWLEFLTSIGFGLITFKQADLTPYTLFLSLFCFLLPIATWAFLKPFFSKASQVSSLKQQLNKFKYNSELFIQALENQPHYAVPEDLMPIILGNPLAENIITMVSNPFCDPCAKAHQQLDEWLRQRNDLQLKIIFTTADHDDDEKTKMARHINALAKSNNMAFVENALSDWYAQTQKKYDTWAEQYPVSLNGDINKVTERQKAWCELAEIAFTPTILVNGYKLPEPYKLEDIKYLIN